MLDFERLAAVKAARRTVILGITSGALIALYGLYISREHITHIGYVMGLDMLEAETLFVFIDFVAIYGKILTSKRLAAKTRRIGYRLLALGGLLSLACNVSSGLLHGAIGKAIYGAGIVAIVAVIEYAIANTKPKTTAKSSNRARKSEPELTPRQIAARKAWQKRRQKRDELAALEAAYSATPSNI